MPKRKALTAVPRPFPVLGKEAVTVKPYRAEVELVGTEPLLFDAWETRRDGGGTLKAADVGLDKAEWWEPMVYQNGAGLGIPASNIVAAIGDAGQDFADPRGSSKKGSARECVFRAIRILNDDVIPLGIKVPTFMAHIRVPAGGAKRGAVDAWYPGVAAGWKMAFRVEVTRPDFVSPKSLGDLLYVAGTYGLGPARPRYGRFQYRLLSIEE